MNRPRKDRIMSVRFTEEMSAKLSERANKLGQSASDMLRDAALSLFAKPIGWRCEHFNISGPEGALTSVSADCGCDMRPFFEPLPLVG